MNPILDFFLRRRNFKIPISITRDEAMRRFDGFPHAAPTPTGTGFGLMICREGEGLGLYISNLGPEVKLGSIQFEASENTVKAMVHLAAPKIFHLFWMGWGGMMLGMMIYSLFSSPSTPVPAIAGIIVLIPFICSPGIVFRFQTRQFKGWLGTYLRPLTS